MQVKDVPLNAQRITILDEVRTMMFAMGQPLDNRYNVVFITPDGEVYGLKGSIMNRDETLDYLGVI